MPVPEAHREIAAREYDYEITPDIMATADCHDPMNLWVYAWSRLHCRHLDARAAKGLDLRMGAGRVFMG